MKAGGAQPPKGNNTKDKTVFRMYIVQIIRKENTGKKMKKREVI